MPPAAVSASPHPVALTPAEEAGERRAAEFFAGIGLVRVALEQAGWSVAFANDIDPVKARMYQENWPADSHLTLGDIHALSADVLPACELFTASFPCNDLSIAGKRAGLAGKESSAFWGLVRLLHDLGARRPQFVLLENVVGFLTSHQGGDLRSAIEALNELDYAVDAVVLNAERWTPQSRARLFLVAERGATPTQAGLLTPNEARPVALQKFIRDHSTLKWRLRELPTLPRRAQQLSDIIEELPDDDSQWWNAERTQYFWDQLSDAHRTRAEALRDQPATTYATAFRRVRKGRSMAELRTDGVAGCLRTPRGGSGRQILVAFGGGRFRVRLLTGRECARLQGAPEDFRIAATLNQALFGFGDAVCVPAVKWIIENLIETPSAPRRSPSLFG